MKNVIYILLVISCAFSSALPQSVSSEEQFLFNVEKNIENGNIVEAEQKLFKYLVENPKNARGYFILARLRYGQGRLNEAKSLSERALSIDGEIISARILLAEILTDQLKAEEAKSVLAGISDSAVGNDLVRLKLAEAHVSVGDCAAALASVDKLPELMQNSDALGVRAECFLLDGARSEIEGLLPLAHLAVKNSPLAGLKFAKVLSKAGLHKEAAGVLEKVVDILPLNVEALQILAKSEIYLKNFDRAEALIAKAEKTGSISAKMFYLKALLENGRQNPAKAFEYLDSSLQIDADSKEVLSSFVLTAIRVNQNPKALLAAEKLIGFERQNPEFIYLYGAALLQNKKFKEAESFLGEYFKIVPKDSRGCLALGFAIAAQPEKLADARRQMEKCLEINPGTYDAAYQLGLSYKAHGETEKAIRYLEMTISISPGYAPALRDLGVLYLQSGDESKARAVLEKAAALKPEDADTHFQLSRLYNLTGDKALARKHFEIFQKLNTTVKKGME